MNDVRLSYLDMFLAADPVVKLVIVVLLVGSVACWALIADVAIQVRRLRRGIEGGGSGALAALLPSGRDAAAKASHLPSDQRLDYVETAMRHVLAQALEVADRSLPALGIITTAAPFVGLFGTVWGIMHSFGAIAAAQDTSLSVVAPGIAEALLATALGLAAAIPAAIGHMRFSGMLSRLSKQGQRLIERVALDLCIDPRRES
jgi:biopolymer transport protein ExbB/TolQ